MTGHAIVTGSSGGIGAAVCRLLHQDGWSVSGLDLAAPADLPLWDHVPVDLSGPGAAADAVKAARKRHGPVAVLVHCAAVQTLGGAGTVPADAWQRTFQVNVVTLDELTGACREDLIAAQGAIVAISSVHASATTPGIAAYATSKAALNGWVRAAALDLAPAVRVNAIQPGAVRTNMLVEGLARNAASRDLEEELNIVRKKIPLQFVAEPHHIAELVVELVNPKVNRYMTGSILSLDGGALIHLSTE